MVNLSVSCLCLLAMSTTATAAYLFAIVRLSAFLSRHFLNCRRGTLHAYDVSRQSSVEYHDHGCLPCGFNMSVSSSSS